MEKEEREFQFSRELEHGRLGLERKALRGRQLEVQKAQLNVAASV